MRDIERCKARSSGLEIVDEMVKQILDEAWRIMVNSKWSQKVIKPARISPNLPSENAGNQLNTNGEPSRRLDPKNVQEDESEQQKHWQETQKNWRKRKVGDTHHYGGGVVERDRVYSPVKGTRDGHARVVRAERIEKAKFESEKWGMLRICKEIIAKSGEKWKRRGKEETQRIREKGETDVFEDSRGEEKEVWKEELGPINRHSSFFLF